MGLFGDLKDGTYITINTNFRSLYISFMSLFRCSTGENWNAIMHECIDQTGNIAIVYWLSFQFITYFIFMNVFVAVIYESFVSIQASED